MGLKWMSERWARVNTGNGGFVAVARTLEAAASLGNAHIQVHSGLIVSSPLNSILRPRPPPASNWSCRDAQKIVLLLRSTLLTLNDAIQTGNFTVLRDVGAPGFRDANTARLSQAFSNLANQGVDLSAVTAIAPQLSEAPALDQQKGMLHLKGYFPGQPVQINFEVLYQAVGGRWRLFGLSVQPASAAPVPP